MQDVFPSGSTVLWRVLRRAACSSVRRLAMTTAMTAGALALSFSAASAFGATAPDASFNDPLTTAASPSSLATHSLMVGVAKAGPNLVAVGRRGLILMSSNAGKSWTQVASPVAADLTAIRFSDANHGWIVGHDAVVLKSTDGGLSWRRALDGRAILNIILKTYTARSAAGDAVATSVMNDAKASAAQSATPGVYPYPLLDVWFANNSEGFVVGAFGLILHTTDSGVTWTPWIERTENDHMNHIYAVNGVAGQVYIAGEQGFLRRLNSAGDGFVKMSSPYKGSYFGLYIQKDLLVAYGLRGNAYVSVDEGAQWNQVNTGLSDNIVAAFPGSGQDLLFVSQAGDMLSTDRVGGSAKAFKVKRASEVYGAVPSGGAIVTMGLAGINIVSLPATAP
ncbi:YCF48-related protein [Glaciimonas immobilis]|uniref:Photosystem II stability/assembly factor-like uncharacterized protein n=1 Tax=Glaciimonas immobilis TaxID=728004 RepID=A0A840RYF2_9BURK|nr:YCF48-related protein [Glaciimonas immobilis]KAF3996170.1 glycosyl hydrolase [Glaciimonas immobilis]MBB5201674.1 photosystem II stability/assembly factor-like uncharacterized protein [Glaciimonas immobilis]